jgi:hypothetical protein
VSLADRRACVCVRCVRVTSADSSSAGPDLYVEAATHFYRALRVYPQPVELLMSELIERSLLSRPLPQFPTAPYPYVPCHLVGYRRFMADNPSLPEGRPSPCLRSPPRAHSPHRWSSRRPRCFRGINRTSPAPAGLGRRYRRVEPRYLDRVRGGWEPERRERHERDQRVGEGQR